MHFVITHPHGDSSAKETLGWSEYSYYYLATKMGDFLLKAGHTVDWATTAEQLNSRVLKFLEQGKFDVIHLAFSPPHRATVTSLTDNYIFIAWEYPDIPLHNSYESAYGNWARHLRAFQRIFVFSSHTAAAIKKADEKLKPIVMRKEFLYSKPPIFSKNVPEIQARTLASHSIGNESSQELGAVGGAISLKQLYREKIRPRIPKKAHKVIVRIYRIFEKYRNRSRNLGEFSTDLLNVNLLERVAGKYVISSWLNPNDIRKNSEMLIELFCSVARKRPQCILLVKLHCSESEAQQFLNSVRKTRKRFGIESESIYLVSGHLSEYDCHKIRALSDLYINVSSGEGLCLPVIEHAIAGIKCLIPRNSAFLDYPVNQQFTFVDCDEIPTNFPATTQDIIETTTYPPIFKELEELLIQQIVSDEDSRLDQLRLQQLAADWLLGENEKCVLLDG
jgi:hypothetical protein